MPQYFGASVPRGLAVPLLADDAFYGHLKGKIQRPGGGEPCFSLLLPSCLRRLLSGRFTFCSKAIPVNEKRYELPDFLTPEAKRPDVTSLYSLTVG